MRVCDFPIIIFLFVETKTLEDIDILRSIQFKCPHHAKRPSHRRRGPQTLALALRIMIYRPPWDKRLPPRGEA